MMHIFTQQIVLLSYCTSIVHRFEDVELWLLEPTSTISDETNHGASTATTSPRGRSIRRL